MIYEHHREKRHWPAALLLTAIAVACILAPSLSRSTVFSPATPKITPAKNPVFKIPFAAELPTEPVAGILVADE